MLRTLFATVLMVSSASVQAASVIPVDAHWSVNTAVTGHTSPELAYRITTEEGCKITVGGPRAVLDIQGPCHDLKMEGAN